MPHCRSSHYHKITAAPNCQSPQCHKIKAMPHCQSPKPHKTKTMPNCQSPKPPKIEAVPHLQSPQCHEIKTMPHCQSPKWPKIRVVPHFQSSDHASDQAGSGGWSDECCHAFTDQRESECCLTVTIEHASDTCINSFLTVFILHSITLELLHACKLAMQTYTSANAGFRFRFFIHQVLQRVLKAVSIQT